MLSYDWPSGTNVSQHILEQAIEIEYHFISEEPLSSSDRNYGETSIEQVENNTAGEEIATRSIRKCTGGFKISITVSPPSPLPPSSQ